MKIGIISDTHGDLVQVEKALKILEDCKYIIHCGDVLYHGPRNDLPKMEAREVCGLHLGYPNPCISWPGKSWKVLV